MTGKARRNWQVRLGRSAAVVGAVITAGAVAAGFAAAPGLASSALSSGGTRTAGSPAAPTGGVLRAGGPVVGARTGWAPVPYRRAQLSVPGQWLVESPGQLFCGPGFKGMIFAGIRPRIPKGQGCGLAKSLAWILPAGHIPAGIKHRKPTAVINGIPVYRLTSGQDAVLYLVPKLGVRVGASGPLYRQVLRTLTRSPLSVVLSRGPVSRAPATWSWHQFGGIRFAVPRTWHPRAESQWATCGTGLEPGTLLLIDATKPPAALPCPFPLPTASEQRAEPGLTVVTGKYAAKSVGEEFTRCYPRHGIRICLAKVTGAGGALSAVLIFSAGRPHQHKATYLLLGLSGSGARARQIFSSIHSARH